MKQINIRAYRIINSNDIAISSQELLDFLNTDLGSGIGNDEKMLALNRCLNLRESIPIFKALACSSIDDSKTICRFDYILELNFGN